MVRWTNTQFFYEWEIWSQKNHTIYPNLYTVHHNQDWYWALIFAQPQLCHNFFSFVHTKSLSFPKGLWDIDPSTLIGQIPSDIWSILLNGIFISNLKFWPLNNSIKSTIDNRKKCWVSLYLMKNSHFRFLMIFLKSTKISGLLLHVLHAISNQQSLNK